MSRCGRAGFAQDRWENDVTSIEEVLSRTKIITFDCYGTLIDWSSGLEQALDAMFGSAIEHRMHAMIKAYVEIEARIECQRYRPYRDVMAEAAVQLAEQFDLGLTGNRAGVLARTLPGWMPFPDTNEALARLKKRYRLGVLSNVDRDLFAGTAANFDIAFDFVVTAEDVRSYKPALAHFRRMLEEHAAGESVLHVGQSLFHDGVATGKVNIPFVWINRYDSRNKLGVEMVAEYPDLKSLADAADG